MTLDLSVVEITTVVFNLAVAGLCCVAAWATVQFVSVARAAVHVGTVASAEAVGLAGRAIGHGLSIVGSVTAALATKGAGQARADVKTDPTPFLSSLMQQPPEMTPPFLMVQTLDEGAPTGVVRVSTAVVRWLGKQYFDDKLTQRSLETAIKLYSHLVGGLKLWTPDPRLVYHDDAPTRVKFEWTHGEHHLTACADEDGKVEWFHWTSNGGPSWAGTSDFSNLIPANLPDEVKAMIADHPAEDFGLSSDDD